MSAAPSFRLTFLLLALLCGCPTPLERQGRPAGATDHAGPERALSAAPAATAPQRPGGAPQALPLASPPGNEAPAAQGAAGRQPFGLEALYQVKRLDAPQLSPDGRQVLFTVTRYELAAGKSQSDIYRVNSDGSGLRRLTQHEAADSQPRWLPDGQALIFVSDRSGKPQLWRMPTDGGEPEQLTKLPTGVDGPVVSPDGALVAFASQVYPELGADSAANQALLQRSEKSPFQAIVADELLYRHWSFYKEGLRSHVLIYELASGELWDATPGDFDAPAFSLGGVGYAFSPDSQELCFVSNREEGSAQAWTTNKDLFVTPVRGGGLPLNLTAANLAYDGEPAYSPDGRSIAYLRQSQPGYESDRLELALYDRQSGRVRILSAGLDAWVLDFRWAADSASLLLQIPQAGRFPLYRLTVADGRAVPLLPAAADFDLAADGTIAYTASSVGRPLELYSWQAGGAPPRQLTQLNAELLARYDARPAEELWLPGAEGQQVHTFIVKPHGFTPGKRYPLIINVHGGPQYQWADTFRGDWQVYPAAGYVVAFFNPHGSIGYGQAYTAAISKDWGGKVYQDVLAVTEALAQLPYVDAARVGAMGWSYGGYMMNWLLGHSDRFKAIASTMGIYDLASFYGATEELWFPEWDIGGSPWENPEAYRRFSPSSHADRFATPTLIINGVKDYRVPYTQGLQLHTALRRQGVPARLVLLPKDGHWPSVARSMPIYYAAHLDWFARYLGGAPSPVSVEALIRGEAFPPTDEKGADR